MFWKNGVLVSEIESLQENLVNQYNTIIMKISNKAYLQNVARPEFISM